jgi:hypothetical protein
MTFGSSEPSAGCSTAQPCLTRSGYDPNDRRINHADPDIRSTTRRYGSCTSFLLVLAGISRDARRTAIDELSTVRSGGRGVMTCACQTTPGPAPSVLRNSCIPGSEDLSLRSRRASCLRRRCRRRSPVQGRRHREVVVDLGDECGDGDRLCVLDRLESSSRYPLRLWSASSNVLVTHPLSLVGSPRGVLKHEPGVADAARGGPHAARRGPVGSSDDRTHRPRGQRDRRSV